ncbi:ABC transporter permease [Lentzea jiangxiensis]|uniref:ABC-2 type transport system permease protein n=1 Tax=Lentzea jiangxiensis TaxID=641025 RepID=A0A1H0X3U8_9PSEU|nr:ABC transporter permease [Lentzea jiangxiensis]SDP97519.1 ABC-2 type transport system permease protein [Lentzea jiangxiensis]
MGLKAELLRHKRTTQTRLTFALAAIVPVLLVLTFAGAPASAPWLGGDIEQLATASGGNFAMFVLFASCRLALPMIVAVAFGSAIASEASWQTLKYLLALPVPRHRLLWIKACSAWVRCAAAFAVVAVSAVVAGTVAFGTSDAVSPLGESVSYGQCLLMAAQMIGYELVHLLWLGGAALVVSVSTNRTLVAWGLPLAVSNLSQILDDLPLPESVRELLPSHFGFAWLDLTSTDPDWANVTKGALSALLYFAACYALAHHIFRKKDITW